MSQKRILITGAAGFLGSHLSDRLIKEGYIVNTMDFNYRGTCNTLPILSNLKIRLQGRTENEIKSIFAFFYYNSHYFINFI